MTRSTRILSPLAVVGLIIVLLVQTPGINAKSDQSSLPSHTPFHTPRGPLHVSNTFSYAVGIPAIHPRSVSNSPNTPSFTAEDAQAYMLTASQPKLTPVQGIHLTIEEVLFTTSHEATQLMKGEDPGLPGDALVCVVLLKGPFQVQVDLPPGTPESAAPIATNVGVVFDAHTGNLLEWAVLDSFPGSSPTHAHVQPSAQSITPNISYSCWSRCYGTNYWPNPVNGAYTYLNWPYPNITRFYYGNGFVQNTMWLLDETSSNCPGVCWVEAGLRAYAVNGSNATVLFWADQRPGYPYADHYGAVVNTLNSTCCIDIQIWKAS